MALHGARPNEALKLIDVEGGGHWRHFTAANMPDDCKEVMEGLGASKGWRFHLGAELTKTKVPYAWVIPDDRRYPAMQALGKRVDEVRKTPIRGGTKANPERLTPQRLLAQMSARLQKLLKDLEIAPPVLPEGCVDLKHTRWSPKLFRQKTAMAKAEEAAWTTSMQAARAAMKHSSRSRATHTYLLEKPLWVRGPVRDDDEMDPHAEQVEARFRRH